MSKAAEKQAWMWLVKTSKGDFFVTTVGRWEEEEAARKVRVVFEALKIGVTDMIPRKRATSPVSMQCTIYEPERPEPPFGFALLAGRKLWQACDMSAEYEAQLILQGKGDSDAKAK